MFHCPSLVVTTKPTLFQIWAETSMLLMQTCSYSHPFPLFTFTFTPFSSPTWRNHPHHLNNLLTLPLSPGAALFLLLHILHHCSVVIIGTNGNSTLTLPIFLIGPIPKHLYLFLSGFFFFNLLFRQRSLLWAWFHLKGEELDEPLFPYLLFFHWTRP